jgi:hypothetical protein
VAKFCTRSSRGFLDENSSATPKSRIAAARDPWPITSVATMRCDQRRQRDRRPAPLGDVEHVRTIDFKR